MRSFIRSFIGSVYRSCLKSFERVWGASLLPRCTCWFSQREWLPVEISLTRCYRQNGEFVLSPGFHGWYCLIQGKKHGLVRAHWILGSAWYSLWVVLPNMGTYKGHRSDASKLFSFTTHNTPGLYLCPLLFSSFFFWIFFFFIKKK